MLDQYRHFTPKMDGDTAYIYIMLQCFVHPFAKTIKILVGALCGTLREENSYFVNMKLSDQVVSTLRNGVLVEDFVEIHDFSQCKPLFAHNFG